MPQSGAAISRSGPACGNARRMRSATVSGVSTVVGGQVEHAEDDRLLRERVEHVELQAGLGGLDAHLVALGRRQLGQERVAARPLVDDRRVAEQMWTALVPGSRLWRGAGRPGRTRGRARASLHVGLVDLDHVRSRLEQIEDLAAHRVRVRHADLVGRPVVVVLGLLGHRERPGHRDLDRAAGVRAQELDVAHLYRPRAGPRGRPRAARGWDGRCGRARCPGSRCRRPRARWRSGSSSSRDASRHR